MKGNIAGLMQQAQKMQQEMQKAQEELANMVVTGEAAGGMVKVTPPCYLLCDRTLVSFRFFIILMIFYTLVPFRSSFTLFIYLLLVTCSGLFKTPNSTTPLPSCFLSRSIAPYRPLPSFPSAFPY